MRFMSIWAALAVTTLVAGSAEAHHSFAMFDQAKLVVLQGTIRTFEWTNPHSWIEIDVPTAGGATRTWNIELNSPNNLVRQGWKRTSVSTGDKVKMTIHPLRDGKPGGLFLDVTLPDGKVLDSGLPKDGRPINTPTA